ncbi:MULTISPECIES: phosphoribosylformylglycinamidine synthase subunit PurS [Cryobacterium]|uniref:Phosphoribosylformylglycinamidine synthase subunit PurS n=1 Tax=Cryobacterium levicorallinum TaxID=995038 RepID=A0A1I2XPN9_9MICO|nr:MULTISPECIES: phosphoribosylformylglycinamidine synthase subunit PurS [Cryobacterium]TFB84892.1 phosphoribosylformylglycinamidine synthase [Cryobacterium levicorallinum]TFD57891.1 phosphoribosylformylglycinamidine synthase [Cryobacterium sp. Hh38]GEP26072.1 phosphoribosylformylglycinamidine synthase subunit PurS [Cryobacterium levicorallinum]SFH14666.1 phosphoribosylformylglycinamidine synthase [Cryobacterium levicorallinum]
MPTIVVEVMPKAELLDPQGKAVAGALGRLGQTQSALANVTGVRVGKRFEISIDGEADATTLAAVRELADTVLSNSVIEDVVGIHVQDAPSSAVA